MILQDLTPNMTPNKGAKPSLSGAKINPPGKEPSARCFQTTGPAALYFSILVIFVPCKPRPPISPF